MQGNWKSARQMWLGSIAIDFDGTICKQNFPKIGDPQPGVREALNKIRKMGFRIIIHTCRIASYWKFLTGQDPITYYHVIDEYMKKHDLPYDEIWTSDKPMVWRHIDDSAISFNGNWKRAIKELEKTLPAREKELIYDVPQGMRQMAELTKKLAKKEIMKAVKHNRKTRR